MIAISKYTYGQKLRVWIPEFEFLQIAMRKYHAFSLILLSNDFSRSPLQSPHYLYVYDDTYAPGVGLVMQELLLSSGQKKGFK